MAGRMEVDPLAVATVTLTWTESRRTNTATVRVSAEGLDLDRAVDLLIVGAEASTDPTYQATAVEIVERVTRTRRPPFPKPQRPGKPDVAVGPGRIEPPAALDRPR